MGSTSCQPHSNNNKQIITLSQKITSSDYLIISVVEVMFKSKLAEHFPGRFSEMMSLRFSDR